VAYDSQTGVLREGDHAPEFTASLSDGGSFSLAAHRGKNNVVLIFYPKDFTPGCTKELCLFRDSHDSLVDKGAVVLGISYDTADSHRKFAEGHHLPFPLISDVDRSISRMYGTERFLGSILGSRRVTVIIDKRGVVRKVARHELAVSDHLHDAIATLQMLEEEEAQMGSKPGGVKPSR
jgi:peroxiredoxin Q/BCP